MYKYIIVSLICWNSHADIDNLFTVNSELCPVAHKWKNIGLVLRLQTHVPSTIERNHTDMHGLLNNLTEWLNKGYNTAHFGNPLWQLLVAAVVHQAGGNNPVLSQGIARKYNGECVMLHVYTVSLCSFTCQINEALP